MAGALRAASLPQALQSAARPLRASGPGFEYLLGLADRPGLPDGSGALVQKHLQSLLEFKAPPRQKPSTSIWTGCWTNAGCHGQRHALRVFMAVNGKDRQSRKKWGGNERADGGRVWLETEGWPRACRILAEFRISLIFFGVFILYRRLVLAEYEISYYHYGYAFFKALVLAKIVMIGDFLGLARRLRDKPLIVTTLYKAVVFAVWVFFLQMSSSMRSMRFCTGRGFSEVFPGLRPTSMNCLRGCWSSFLPSYPFSRSRNWGKYWG